MQALSLTEDQAQAESEIFSFIANPETHFHVLKGYSGTGKTTLIRRILANLRSYLKAAQLLSANHPGVRMEVMLTATTHKAAEALAKQTGEEVNTVFSALGLRIQTNYRTNKTSLVGDFTTPLEGTLLIVDEASYANDELLQIITSRVTSAKFSKVLLIGDPKQLLGVGETEARAFTLGFPESELKEVVRQADTSPIISFSTMLRNAVDAGVFTPFKIDGSVIQHLNAEDFTAQMETVFKSSRGTNSRILAWRNVAVKRYNDYLTNMLHGQQHFHDGDIVSVNSYVHGNNPLKNNQEVIVYAPERTHRYGVIGTSYLIRNVRYFCPDDLNAHATKLAEARENQDDQLIAELMETWADLRPLYAQTVNKAQGSTYDAVFIDLNDLGSCPDKKQLARLLYVAVSRAQNNVYLFGDLS
jgi:hypothetical protein